MHSSKPWVIYIPTEPQNKLPLSGGMKAHRKEDGEIRRFPSHKAAINEAQRMVQKGLISSYEINTLLAV